VKLYDSALAPNPRRVRVFLAEKGIEVPTVSIDIVKAENRQPAFLVKNPLGGVPVLELDDGTTLSESTAICRYFEEVQPDPPLMGTDARDRAIVEMWLRRVEFEVAFPIMQTFRNTHDFFKGRIPQVAEWGTVCRKQALEQLAWLDGEMADRPFVAGDRHDRRHHFVDRSRLRSGVGHPHRSGAQESDSLVRRSFLQAQRQGLKT